MAKDHVLKEAAAKSSFRKASAKRATRGKTPAPTSVASSAASPPISVNADVHLRGMHISYCYSLLIALTEYIGSASATAGTDQNSTPEEQNIQLVTLQGEYFVHL